jgi:hypothetical protein
MNGLRLSLALVAALAGFAGAQPRPNSHAPGTTWVNQVRNTGSFGNVNEEQRVRVAGERMWGGRKAFVWENVTTGISTLWDAETGRLIAQARGDAPIASWEPAFGWERPLEVGKSWSRTHNFTNHANMRTTEFVGNWKVEALEDVTVPAGTFKCYKIVYSDYYFESATWWSPEFDAFVKVSGRRNARHGAGPGTIDQELVQRPKAP